MKPIEVDYDLEGTYDILKRYFIRENNPFNVTSDYIGEDGFTIDFIRSYSFVASTYKATIHLAGFEKEDGGTLIKMHAKSGDDPDKLDREVRGRIEEMLVRTIAEKKNMPIKDEPTEDTTAADRRQLIILLIVAAIIIIGIMPWSCSDTFSKYWIF